VTGLDTSLVIRLLIGEPVDQAKRARLFLDELFKAGERASVSDLVLSEVYFALQYHYQVPKAEILETLRLLLQSNEIIAGGVALEVLKTKNLATANP
jgi:predicted nucleic acid-binding protein